MQHYSLSDKGKIRENNQDNYSNYIGEKFSLFVIADGMGGHNGGEVASEMAVELIREYIINHKDYDNFNQLLKEAIEYANSKIFIKSQKDPNLNSMGTTVVAVIIDEDKLYVSHVGDSRGYYYDHNNLTRITKDHSYVQNLIDVGVLTEDTAKDYKNKNLVTKAVGVSQEVEVSQKTIAFKKPAIIMLATDGLTGLVEDEEIEDVLKMDIELRDMSEILVYMANSMGGYDNISVTLIRIME